MLALACGGSDGGGATPTPTPSPAPPAGTATITISNFTYNPSNLTVTAGTTVTVVNQDNTPHSVTSSSSAGSFTPGGVSGVAFDTGAFNGTKTFTIPSSAPSGTQIPYYCSVHLGAMRNFG